MFEVLPAARLGNDRYELLGSPGLALGCAVGDIIRRSPDGRFVVELKGGQHCVQAAAMGPLPDAGLQTLSNLAQRFKGIAEWPHDRRLAVLTLPESTFLPEAESALDAWANTIPDARWWFGNQE
ncbi:DUF4265 domain-containing protein [Nonomuraea angiospora]|uniref:DUF4265 domain-containing protein n=1 Tax=Nonomuraea angiospora TaxID=46172 RepID=A0ABR9M9V3_9ACTN|nr:DUF4265 domain-containing protein [Nonomuraea angiospora]MBE1589699.1 hypothetical protein [Nonomuraea angiospora]